MSRSIHAQVAGCKRIRISPTHNAVWAYVEWCCDNGRPWPGIRKMARDLARSEHEVSRVFRHLGEIGVLTTRTIEGYDGREIVVRLGDGRETPHYRYPQTFPFINIVRSRHIVSRRGSMRRTRMRIAA